MTHCQSINQLDSQLILHFFPFLFLLAVLMAPTVCFEKKVRVAGMKEARRRTNTSVSQAHAVNPTAAAAAADTAIQNSAVLSYGE